MAIVSICLHVCLSHRCTVSKRCKLISTGSYQQCPKGMKDSSFRIFKVFLKFESPGSLQGEMRKG